MTKKARTVRLPEDLNRRIEQYAAKEGLSANEVIIEAVDFYLKVRTGLYEFDDLSLERLNQIVDAQNGFNLRMDRVQVMLSDITDLITRYTAGENYL